ncbi:MAG: bifunctional adenosylcobinamide kinase/adenosylcobinamide-phosphate guanylyltransferase [Actinomycetes bacterium]
MDVALLGTGSADGWPNAFCRCPSCAAQHAAGRVRAPTAVLVDERLLLDCGPEAPRSALRAERRLDRVQVILLTHDHPDHSAPMALLSRSWANPAEADGGDTIVVAGPAAVLERWRQWCHPQSQVDWRPLEEGDVLAACGYVVRALPADHDPPALLYTVEDGVGQRLFYGADTGPLPDATVQALGRRPVDVLLLEETFGRRSDHGTRHLDLSTFGHQLARIRDAGGLRPGAHVVAVHLGHHNPPEPQLVRELAAWGARPGEDGETLTSPSASGRSPALDRRHRRTLLLGGARSGKSTAAERRLAAEREVTYVAPGPRADGSDLDWDERVRRHQERRPAGWVTVETTDPAAVLRSSTTPVLLDCLGTWLAGVLAEEGAWDGAAGWEDRTRSRIDDLLDAWRSVEVPVVAVSNEVGSGVVPAHRSGMVFRDWLGRLNQAVAAESEQVLLVVAGRVLELA